MSASVGSDAGGAIGAGGRSLLGNVSRSLAASALDTAGALVVALLAARLLGDRSNGHYAFAVSLSSFVVAICGFGLPAFTVRQSARRLGAGEDPAKDVQGAITVYAIWCMPAAGCSLAALVFFGSPAHADHLVLSLAGLYGVVMGATGLLNAALQGREDFTASILASVLQRSGALLFLLLGSFGGGGVRMYVAGVALTQVVVAVVMGRRVCSAYGISSLIEPAPLNDQLALLRRSLPFAVTVVLEVIYFRGVTAALGYVQAPAIVGLFAAAHTLFTGSMLPAYAAATAMYPRLSAAWVGDSDRALGMARRLLSLVATYGLLAGVVLYLTTPTLVGTLLGPQYRESVGVLRVLALALPLTATARFLTFWFNASGRANRASTMSACAVLAVATVGVPLCARMGAIGGAWATVLVELTLVCSAVALGALRPTAATRSTSVLL